MQAREETDQLPSEIWNFIFGLGILNKLDLKYASMVCKYFNDLIKHNKSALIKNASWPLPDYTQRLPERDHVFFKAETEIVSLSELKNGDFICGLSNGIIHVLDADSRECKLTLEGHFDSIKAKLNALAQFSFFNFDASWFRKIKNPVRTIHEHSNGDIVSGADDYTICIHDIQSGKCKKKLTGHTHYVVAIKELQNGDIVSGSSDNNLRIWDIETGECKRIADVGDACITAVAVHKNGKIISGLINGSMCIDYIENIALGTSKKLLEGHTEKINAITILEGGNIVSGADDATLRIWDVETSQCIQILHHTKPITAITVLKNDNGNIVTGSDDGSLCVWNIKSGKCEQILEGHNDRITAIVATKSGAIASISDDTTLRIWSFGFLDRRQDAEQVVVPANKMKL